MAYPIVIIPENTKVEIRSKKNAANPQRFAVEREIVLYSENWQLISFYPAGETVHYDEWPNGTTRLRITGDNQDGGWRQSRMHSYYPISTTFWQLSCDDDFTGDDDFDDLIVQVDLANHFAGHVGILDFPLKP